MLAIVEVAFCSHNYEVLELAVGSDLRTGDFCSPHSTGAPLRWVKLRGSGRLGQAHSESAVCPFSLLDSFQRSLLTCPRVRRGVEGQG